MHTHFPDKIAGIIYILHQKGFIKIKMTIICKHSYHLSIIPFSCFHKFLNMMNHVEIVLYNQSGIIVQSIWYAYMVQKTSDIIAVCIV